MSLNLDKIRAVPIEQFMVTNGFRIQNSTTSNFFFHSPFRNEKTASFSVWRKKNRWKDFGTGEGGDIIELAQKIWNVDFKTAIEKLSKQNYIAIDNIEVAPNKNSEIILKKVVDVVSNKALLEYMKERKLKPNKITGLVGEIYYSKNKKNYFGLAFKNDLGGYEYRNKYFKGCFGTKHFTTIKKGFDSISIFEGFIDFLSLASYKEIKSDILVLNSCSMAEKAIFSINEYKKAYLLLDNDKTGNETTELISNYSTSHTIDLRKKLYPNFKDLNDSITQKK